MKAIRVWDRAAILSPVSPCPQTGMAILHHYPFCPHSRFVRLILSEMSIEPELREERPWERRTEFLAINLAGATPVLMNGQGFSVPGANVIAEYLDETCGAGMA